MRGINRMAAKTKPMPVLRTFEKRDCGRGARLAESNRIFFEVLKRNDPLRPNGK